MITLLDYQDLVQQAMQPPGLDLLKVAKIKGDTIDQNFVKALDSAGIQWHVAENRLYVTTPTTLLDSDAFHSRFKAQTKHAGLVAKLYFSTDSTNVQASSLLNQTGVTCCVVTAEHQTGGKGRLGRTWNSPFGRNIYLSVGYSYPLGQEVRQESSFIQSLSALPLAVGVIAVKNLQNFGVPDVRLKWPNDLLRPRNQSYKDTVNNPAPLGPIFGKMGGILCESSIIGEQMHVIAGIGINVNMSEKLGPMDYPWADLSHLQINRTTLTIALASDILKCFSSWNQNSFAEMRDDWNALDAFQKQIVSIHFGDDKPSLQGVNNGTHHDGRLKISPIYQDERKSTQNSMGNSMGVSMGTSPDIAATRATSEILVDTGNVSLRLT